MKSDLHVSAKQWPRFFYTCFLVILWSIYVFPAEDMPFRFQRYNVDDGLAQNSAFAIQQDKKGFLWVGTEQGLNRFDGHTFTILKYQFDNPNSLSNDYVLSIHEDSLGFLWVGTSGGGLNRFDPTKEEFTHYLVDAENIDSLSNVINTIYEDRQGKIWVGTNGGGLYEFARQSQTFIRYVIPTGSPDPVNLNIVNHIHEDFTGTLWVATNGGLLRLDRRQKQLKPHPLPLPPSKNPELPGILYIYEDSQQVLWIGSRNGFYKREKNSLTFIRFTIPAPEKVFISTNTVQVMFEDRFGVFWLGTTNGLHIFDRQDYSFQSFYTELQNHDSLASNGIRTIYEDRSGALWIGLYGGGLNKLNRVKPSFKRYYNNPQRPDLISDGAVFSLWEDRQGILWIGTYADGLNAYNRHTGEVKSYQYEPGNPNSLSNNNIWEIYQDHQGTLWIGTAEGGLNSFSAATGKFTRYLHQPENPNSLSNNSVSAITEDANGILWIGTNAGLDKYNPQYQRFSSYKNNPRDVHSLVHNNVYTLLIDKDGAIWVGTKGGVSVLNTQTQRFESYTFNPYAPTQDTFLPVFSLCQDRQGFIWVGSTSGVFRLNPHTRAFTRFQQKDGLPNDVINGILEDRQGNLWFSTNYGLSKLDTRTYRFQNYNVEDGLQSSEFNGGAYFKNARGELFFGGLNGFNVFYPEQVRNNPFIPPVVITDLRIFNQSVQVGQKIRGRVILEQTIPYTSTITLDNKHHVFSLEYAALSYIYNENNQYAYKMDGLDENWNYTRQRRFVTYSNLAPGDYVFRVKASNNNGVWNEQGVALKIRVLPPFWQTWWFRFLLFGIIVFLFFAYKKAQQRIAARRKHELEDMVANRTTALTESGEKYRAVVETTNHGIAILQENRIVFHNTRLAQMLGFDEKEMHQQSLLQWVVSEKQAEMAQFLTQTGEENRQAATIETVLQHSSGQTIAVEIHFSQIRYKKGLAQLLFFHDIGLKKLLEEERMRIAKLEFTRVLSGGIAHDYNNLLAIMNGNIEMALDEIQPGTRLHLLLVQALRAVERSIELTQKFITLAKGGEPIKKEELLQHAISDMVLPVLEATPVQCSFVLPADLWPVYCDINYIQQALRGIVINSIQAMVGKPEHACLTITGENKELVASPALDVPPGRYVCISIEDTGCGIPEEALPRIFDPYFSTRDDVTQKGLGLGLSMVHSIIIKHQGAIQVESEVGKGTLVRIYLPAIATLTDMNTSHF